MKAINVPNIAEVMKYHKDALEVAEIGIKIVKLRLDKKYTEKKVLKSGL